MKFLFQLLLGQLPTGVVQAFAFLQFWPIPVPVDFPSNYLGQLHLTTLQLPSFSPANGPILSVTNAFLTGLPLCSSAIIIVPAWNFKLSYDR
ncbi:MAG TPA: hypothetical protein VGO47_11145 [Chlamydiales bacterium]|nr:hypothetical protein [Chlamydiales bacterium]